MTKIYKETQMTNSKTMTKIRRIALDILSDLMILGLGVLIAYYIKIFILD